MWLLRYIPPAPSVGICTNSLRFRDKSPDFCSIPIQPNVVNSFRNCVNMTSVCVVSPSTRVCLMHWGVSSWQGQPHRQFFCAYSMLIKMLTWVSFLKYFNTQSLKHPATLYHLLGGFWCVQALPSLFCIYWPPRQPNVKRNRRWILDQ